MNDIYKKQVALLIRIMPQKHQQGIERLKQFFGR